MSSNTDAARRQLVEAFERTIAIETWREATFDYRAKFTLIFAIEYLSLLEKEENEYQKHVSDLPPDCYRNKVPER